MIKRLFNHIITNLNDSKTHPETYHEELDRQCSAINLIGFMVVSIVWLPYLSVDAVCHPEEILLPYLRIGLSVVGLTSIFLYFSPYIQKDKGIILCTVNYGYIIIVTGAITGLANADPQYVGGYIFVIMCSVLLPLPRQNLYVNLYMSGLIFGAICLFRGVSFATPVKRYSLNDLIGVFCVTSVFIYVLDKIRYASYRKSKELEEQKAVVQRANELLLREIAERRRVEQALQEAKLKAESASRAKSEFVASMSHEIRTPLNVITGMANMLWESSLNPEQQNCVRIFKTAGENLLNLINDILDLSKVEAGQIELEAAPFHLPELMNNLHELMIHKANEKQLQLNFYISPHTPEYLIGDSVRLRQILVNLIGNAVKFTHNGVITVKAEYIQDISPAQTRLRFSVTDTGIGIPKDKHEKIFEIFTQADSSTSRKYGGTGLGLSICKRFVEMMGGEIWVESELGNGSTFFFTALFTRGEQPKLEKNDAVFPVRKETATGFINILVVEDNKDNQMVLKFYLKKIPHSMDVADNGKIGVEKYISGSYDLIFMDIEMPEMDGYEASCRIREWENRNEKKPVIIIALTAHAMKSEQEKFFAAGMNDFVTKPIVPEQLYATLERWVTLAPNAALMEEPTKIEFKLPETLAGIDIPSAMNRLNNNTRLFAKLMQSFSTTYANAAETIRHMLQEGDLETARRLAHTVKGLAGNISAMGLYQAALELEKEITATGAGSSNSLIRFEQAVNQVADSARQIETACGELKSMTPAAFNPEKTMELIQQLSEHIAKNSLKAEEYIEPLKSCLKNSECENDVMKLEEEISRFDFKNAGMTLASIAAQITTPNKN